MTKMEITYHASVERADRIIAINTYVGFGYRVLKTEYNPANDTMAILSETGVIRIHSHDESGRLVTAFCASLSQAKRLYNGDRLPNWLYLQIQKNAKRKELQI